MFRPIASDVFIAVEGSPPPQSSEAVPCPPGWLCERPLVRTPCAWRCVPGPPPSYAAICRKVCQRLSA